MVGVQEFRRDVTSVPRKGAPVGPNLVVRHLSIEDLCFRGKYVSSTLPVHRDIPSDGSIESSLAMLGDPYRFIQRRASRLGCEVFRTRLMLRETICMTGVEAARLFYDGEHFARANAAPE